MKTLLTWIGKTDLLASKGDPKAGMGPIAQAAVARQFDEIVLITDFEKKEVEHFTTWLRQQTKSPFVVRYTKLSGPTNFGEIYQSVKAVLTDLSAARKPERAFTFHVSPGTPAMAAVWILLAKTLFHAEVIESSAIAGVQTVNIPFDIAADFIPDLLLQPDSELERLSVGLPPATPEFEKILHRSPEMKRLITRARHVSLRSIPVLIEGESGTGKELLARAIHHASSRRAQPFVVVNCGAIPEELVESELFGHEKGAFTGAAAERKGHFEAADNGTIFLDEIGELPKRSQVKLLRVLQEGEVTRLGSSRARKIDIRIIAATNRVLTEEIALARFREDLFYRLAVAVLRLPPIRDRRGDLGTLIDGLLEQVNGESQSEPGFKNKKLSAGARNVLLQHSWPGNVRELLNTLRRAAVWTPGTTLSEADIREALLPIAGQATGRSSNLLDRNVEEGVDLPAILGEVSASYIKRALHVAQGNKTKAANLLGLGNYQTLTNWMKKNGLGV